MAIEFVRNIISSGYNLSKINDNFQKIQTALEDGLSRSGVTPNQMNADLDMNGNNIINIAGLGAESVIIDGVTVEQYVLNATEAVRLEAEGYADDANQSAIDANNSAIEASGYSVIATNAAAAAGDLVADAVSGFSGFTDGLGYDFGSITSAVTYFDQDWGSIV